MPPADESSGLGRNAGYILQAGSLAAQVAKIEQLGAPHLVAANFFDLIDHLGVEREDALHALAKAHLAHGKGTLGALVDGDDQALKGLQALFVAFLDLDLNANLVAGHKLREVGALELVCQALHYGMNGHWIIPATGLRTFSLLQIRGFTPGPQAR